MSAPPEVVDRLERLAAGAPGAGIDPDALWTRGRRRQRVRTGAVAAALVVVGLVGATTTPLLVDRAQQVEPARTDERMVLPDVIRQPGGWEPAFPSNPGRLSAVGFGVREGLWSSRNGWWGVSASTGESRFLELPGAADVFDAPALSADGWRLAYWVTGDVPGEPLSMGSLDEVDVAPAVGVAVLDLRTGDRDVWTIDSEHGLATSGLAWAGDVLWWSAGTLERSGESGLMGSDIVARRWDVRTDRRLEPSGPGSRVRPNNARPWSRGFVELSNRRRVVVVTGDARRSLRFVLPAGSPREAGTTEAAMSPDGTRLASLLMSDASVFDSAPKPVLVGAVTDGAVELGAIDGVEAQGVAGWRSPSEVVVVSNATVEDGRPPQALRAWAVDVVTGARTELLEFSGGNTPQVAADAWAAEVVPAPDAPFAPDPRLVGLGLLVASFVAWRLAARVRRRRGDA